MPERLMTLEEVAEYLKVDKATVYRLIADKKLPAFKVGNSNLKTPSSSRK
jgi:excisionase family DNA binding protein